jgi:hypothetical protein
LGPPVVLIIARYCPTFAKAANVGHPRFYAFDEPGVVRVNDWPKPAFRSS